MEDELKRLNDENQYMRSAFNILRKNVIIREEKPQMELKPPEILKDDKELIDLTQSVAVVSDKLYSLEKELDNVYRKISQLTTTIAGTERNNDTESSKKINVEARSRKPRNIPAQVTDLSPQCLKLEKDVELITSAWRGMTKKERSHTWQVGKHSKSAGAEGGDVESLNDIDILKDKISGLEILMAALEEYVTSDKQNSNFDVPSDLQSGQMCVMECAQTKRIAQQFEKMKSELSAMDEEKANLKREYDKNFELFWTEYEELKTANAGLEEILKDANAFLTTVESEKAKMEKEYETKIDDLNNEYEKLKTDHRTLEESLGNAYSYLKEVEGEKENIKKEFDQFRAECEELKTTNKTLTVKLMSANALTNLNAEYEKLKIAHQTLEERLMNAYSDIKKVDGEKANMKKDIGTLNDTYEKLKTASASLEANLNNAHSVLKAVENEKEKMKQDYETKSQMTSQDKYKPAGTKDNGTIERLRENPDNVSGDNRPTDSVSPQTSSLSGKPNEVGNPVYLLNCLDTLLQDIFAYAHYSDESVHMRTRLPDESIPESSIAERCQHARDICTRFTKVENDIKELKDKSLGQKIIMDVLDEYVTAEGKSDTFDIPSQLQSDQRFKKEREQAKRIAGKFIKMASLEFFLAKCVELKTTNQAINEKLSRANAVLTAVENEKKKMKEKYLTRLSKLIVDRLTHDNANIADLSNADRPTKLSESFSELYDNEWTDAFEELTDESCLSEADVIRSLLDIVMKAFRKCKEIRWDRYKSLSLIASTLHVTDQNAASAIITDSQEAATGNTNTDTIKENQNESRSDPNIGDDVAKGLFDEASFQRKHFYSPESSTVESTKVKVERETQTEEIVESKTKPLKSTKSIDEKTSLKNIWHSTTLSLRNEALALTYAMLSKRLRTPEISLPKTYKYLTVCCDVCWKMFMQEKPMHLEINAEKQIGEEKLFDTERFRPYTKAGKYVAYVVWPALFLHEGGPMLGKGIAQGCNKVPNT